MKNHLLKNLFACLLVFTGTTASAHDCKVDGICYNLNIADQTAIVTYESEYSGNYSGVVHIPEKIVYDGIIYSVTSIGEYAFGYCRGLTEVTIPNSVTFIEDYAFCWLYLEPSKQP